jgi:hypothetical protein
MAALGVRDSKLAHPSVLAVDFDHDRALLKAVKGRQFG